MSYDEGRSLRRQYLVRRRVVRRLVLVSRLLPSTEYNLFDSKNYDIYFSIYSKLLASPISCCPVAHRAPGQRECARVVQNIR